MLIVTSVSLQFACGGLQCDEEGCEPTVRAEFTKSTAWEAGAWAVTLEAGGESIGVCTIELPAGVPPQEEECTGNLGLIIRSDGQAIERATTRQSVATDAELIIRVEQNGELASEQAFEPTFRIYRPNGSGCAPECKQANIDFNF
jgi:hypothetical protein